MGHIYSILYLIQDEHLLVSQNNELITKSKGDINNLTDDERKKLMTIRNSIRMKRSILRGYLSETANYGVPLFVLNEGNLMKNLMKIAEIEKEEIL